MGTPPPASPHKHPHSSCRASRRPPSVSIPPRHQIPHKRRKQLQQRLWGLLMRQVAAAGHHPHPRPHRRRQPTRIDGAADPVVRPRAHQHGQLPQGRQIAVDGAAAEALGAQAGGEQGGVPPLRAQGAAVEVQQLPGAAVGAVPGAAVGNLAWGCVGGVCVWVWVGAGEGGLEDVQRWLGGYTPGCTYSLTPPTIPNHPPT